MPPWFRLFAAWCKETCLDLIGSRQSQRRQIRALRHLDDRLLRDIGLTRRGVRLAESMPADGDTSSTPKKGVINLAPCEDQQYCQRSTSSHIF